MIWLLLFAAAGVVELAAEHRSTLPEIDQRQTVYFSLLPAEGEDQAALQTALELLVCSSTREPVIEHCRPARIGEAPLLALHLERAGWDAPRFVSLLANYPYDPAVSGRGELSPEERLRVPLVIRGDWFLVELADGHRSSAYRELLTPGENAGEPLSTLAEVLTVFGVANEPSDRYGLVEGESGVSKSGVRLIENRPARRGACWITYDVFELTPASDPLENLAGFAPDGQEIIIQIPKVSLASGARGAAQVYYLANAVGELVNRAPVDLVEDTTRFRSYAEIRSPGSCVQCHSGGLNAPTVNDYAAYLAAGNQAYLSPELRRGLDRYYGGGLARELERGNEDYAVFVNATCLTTPEEAASRFRAAIDRYDAPLDLVATAGELGLAPDRWRAALARSGILGGARLVGLATGRTITRAAWEDSYSTAVEIAARFTDENAVDSASTPLDELGGDGLPGAGPAGGERAGGANGRDTANAD